MRYLFLLMLAGHLLVCGYSQTPDLKWDDLNTGVVENAFFTNNGKYIITRSFDGPGKGAAIWDLSDGKLLFKKAGPIELSPDGNKLVYFDNDTTKVMDITNWKVEVSFADSGRDLDFPTPFSPDGKSIITVLKDGTINVWNINDGNLKIKISDEKIFQDEFFRSDYKYYPFSSDSKFITTQSGENGSVKIRKLSDGSIVSDFESIGGVGNSILSADGVYWANIDVDMRKNSRGLISFYKVAQTLEYY